MTRKKWALLVVCILLLLGYFKFFYKTYSKDVVAKSADYIMALDVKRVTNTIIWNVLTTPSQWKKVSFSSSGGISWKDMVKIPDYVFVFHSAGQPANAWYTVLEIKNKNDFDKGLAHYHFEKRTGSNNMPEYFSNELGVEMIQNGNRLLLGNPAMENKDYIRGVANELFIRKQYASRETILKNVDANSHLAFQVLKNGFLQEDAVVKANFDKHSISIDALLTAKKQFSFEANDFSYQPSSLCALGFTQPGAALYGLLPGNTKEAVSKAINFNIDSLLLQSNQYYQLDIAGIKPRVDSAISYTYDDNFNPVEKVVVNNVLEPSFNFYVKGDSVSQLYNYWHSSGKLEKTEAGELFIPMPFVKSYCKKITTTELSVASGDYVLKTGGEQVHAVLFLNMMMSSIPAALLKYLPAGLLNAIANMESFQFVIKKNKEQLELHGSFIKKKNDQPLVDW